MAHSSLRFGMGRFTTEAEIDFVVEKIIATVNKLRDMRCVDEAFWFFFLLLFAAPHYPYSAPLHDRVSITAIVGSLSIACCQAVSGFQSSRDHFLLRSCRVSTNIIFLLLLGTLMRCRNGLSAISSSILFFSPEFHFYFTLLDNNPITTLASHD